MQSATILLVIGSIVCGVVYLIYQLPGNSASVPPPPATIIPISTPPANPQPLFLREEMPNVKVKPAQRETEIQEPEPEQVMAEESPVEEDLSVSNEPTETVSEELLPEPVQEEEQPVEGDWQNRGARLKQGRKLTVHASLLMQKGRYTDASIVLRDAISRFPAGTRDLSYGEALYKLGICLRRKGQPEQAIPILRQAMQFPYYRSKVLREVEAATGQLRAKANPSRR